MPKEHPRYTNFEWPDYEFREFPMMVYPGAPDQKKPYGRDGKPLKGVLVNDEAEYAQVMGDGGTAATVETSASGVSRVRTEADQKAALVEEAETLGVTFDKRWSVARIQDAIDAHRNQAEVV